MRKTKEKSFSPNEAAVISESVKRSENIINEKMKNINWLMAGIVIVLFVAVITMLLMGATSIIDSFHFNSATYKEYSNKIETQNDLLESNKVLLETNKQSQYLIQENQKIIKEFIEKFNKE